MTYCVGILLDAGIIFASDSRTNAGVDNFAKFCKMTVFDRTGDRVIVLLSSGNLAGTQAVIGVFEQRWQALDAMAPEGDETLVALRAELEAAMQAANTDGNYRASKERYDAIAAKAAEGSATALKARATALIAEIEKNLETARYNGFREKNATEWEAVRDGKNLLLPLLQEAKYRMVITDAEPLLERSKSLMD